MGRAEFVEALRKTLPLFERYEKVVVVHHNDADGLSSAAVLKKALERAGHKVETIAIERTHPLIVRRVFELFDDLVVFCDLGSRAAPEIAKINSGKNDVVILDHHIPSKIDDPKVRNISTEFFGLSGEKDISAATAAFIFANVLGENRDLAYLGVIGAIGDSHHRFGRLTGENRSALEEAVRLGQVEVREKDGKETYTLKLFGKDMDIAKFAKGLTVLGAVGFYLGGPETGIKACLEGPGPQYEKKFEELNGIKEEAFARVKKKLEEGALIKTEYIQWFHVGDDFAPMGVKIVGEFCMEIRNEGFIDKDKYIAGFQNMAPEVPKLGKFSWSMAKLSMRVPPPLEEKILAKEMPGIAWLLPEAAKRVGGSIDACHDYAGATTVDNGKEEELINEMNRLVRQFLGS